MTNAVSALISTMNYSCKEILLLANEAFPQDMKRAQEVAEKLGDLITEEGVRLPVALTAVSALLGCLLEAIDKTPVQ